MHGPAISIASAESSSVLPKFLRSRLSSRAVIAWRTDRLSGTGTLSGANAKHVDFGGAKGACFIEIEAEQDRRSVDGTSFREPA